MRARQNLEQFLQDNHINYRLPTDIKEGDDTIYTSIQTVCQVLVATKPEALLSPTNVTNLDKLMLLARNPNFTTDEDENRRPYNFQKAIIELSRNPNCFTQDSFDGIIDLTLQAGVAQDDLLHATNCFIKLAQMLPSLLTRENIQSLIGNILFAPLRPNQESRAMQLSFFLNYTPWLNQADFDFVLQSKLTPKSIYYYMFVLQQKGLKTPENYQALIDGGLVADQDQLNEALAGVNDQHTFNEFLLTICDSKLNELAGKVERIHLPEQDDMENCTVRPGKSKEATQKAISEHIRALHQRLAELFNTAEVRQDPREFLHNLAIVLKAIPTENHQPSKADIQELIDLANAAEGHPSLLWKSVGGVLMVLGSLLAIAAGIALAVCTGGIAAPAGAALAVTATAGIIGGLTGLGLFAYGRTRSGLSEDLMDLAEDIHIPVR